MIHSTLAALVLLPTLGAAATNEPRLDPSADAEVQDVVFFSDARPYLFRLRLRVDGLPFATRWETHMSRLFAWYDRDNNGFLDKTEASRAPHAQMLTFWLQNNFYNPMTVALPFAELDTDKDDKVTLAEFLSYYRRNGVGPIRAMPGFNNAAAANQITDQLFTLLGGSKDAKITRQQFERMETTLLRLDQNDDETVASAELFPGGFAPNYYAQPQPFVRNAGAAAPPVLPLYLVEKESGANQLTQRLKAARDIVARYDKDKNGKLSPAEIGLPQETFTQLDDNKDGQLEATELLRWLIVQPDIEAVLRIGQAPAREPSMVLVTGGGVGASLVAGGQAIFLPFGEGRLDLIRGVSQPIAMNNNLTTYFVQQFKLLDKDNKGFVTAKQVDGPQQVYLRNIFVQADRDNDGKMTEKEMKEWLDLMAGGSNIQMFVSFADTGRGLFELLDANGDGRLSMREMRTAWTRVAGLDKNKDGALARTEIPRQFQMAVGRGFPGYYGGGFARAPVPAVVRPGVTPVARPAPRGPLWFRKMDTNGDGDVSRREFLGSPEDFRKIDTDNDGLISLEEAERADATMRQNAVKK